MRAPTISSKARLGQVDVATNTLLNSIEGENEGLWIALDPSEIPNMANLHPNAIYSPETIYANAGEYVLVYNKEHIPETPTTWEVLWDPQYKNRVVTYDYDNLGLPSLTTPQAENLGGDIDTIAPGLQKIADLKRGGNLITATGTESQIISLMQTGDAWLSMLTTGRVKELLEKGADHIGFARPEEGTFPLVSTLNITKTAQNPEAAKKFVDYVLSPRWQEAFAVNNTYAPSVSNASAPSDYAYVDLLLGADGFSRLYLPDQEKVAARRSEWRDRIYRILSGE